jgi:hypothetical protein
VESLKPNSALRLSPPESFLYLFNEKTSAAQMYYPIYPYQQLLQSNNTGVSVKSIDLDLLDKYYLEMYNADLSYNSYPKLSNDIKNYKKASKEKNEEINNYLSGDIPRKMYKAIINKYKTYEPNIPHEIKESGRIRVRILYDDNDAESNMIFSMYAANLNKIGNYLFSKGKKIKILPIPLRLRDTNAGKITEVPYNAYDIAIYGWNYRFDFLNELVKFLDKDDKVSSSLVEKYNLIFSDLNNIPASEAFNNFIMDINTEELFSTIFGTPNCFIYNNDGIKFKTIKKLGDYFESYPYYWN